MILFTCQCGTAAAADAGAAGQTHTCPNCGQTRAVPEHSEDNCFLVYRSGLPDTGMPISATDLAIQINTGEIKACDLIFHQNEWRPLGDVFEVPKTEAAAPDDNAEPEIAVQLNELEPIPGFISLKKNHWRNFWKTIFLWQRRQRTVQHKPIWQKLFYYLFVLAVLVAGYYLGIGKIINFALARACYVAVYNPDDCDYNVKLRSDNAHMIAQGQVVFPDIYLAARRRAKLQISPIDTPAQPTYEITIPLCPGQDLVVNPEGKIAFGTYDFRGMNEKSLDSKTRQSLFEEIARQQPPTASRLAVVHLKNMAEEHFLGEKNDLMFSSRHYDFKRLSLARSVDYTERQKNKKPQEEVFLPALVKPTPLALNFKGSVLQYDFSRPDAMVALISFSAREFNVYEKKKFSAFRPWSLLTSESSSKAIADNKLECGEVKGSAQLKIDQNSRRLHITFDRVLTGAVKAKGLSYPGQWNFVATLPATGKDQDKWSWQWDFRGTWMPPTPPRGVKPTQSAKKIALTLTHNGDLKVKLD